MTIRFKLDKTEDGKDMVEVWNGDTFIAGIYPHEDAIMIVSKCLDMEMSNAHHHGEDVKVAWIQFKT